MKNFLIVLYVTNLLNIHSCIILKKNIRSYLIFELYRRKLLQKEIHYQRYDVLISSKIQKKNQGLVSKVTILANRTILPLLYNFEEYIKNSIQEYKNLIGYFINNAKNPHNIETPMRLTRSIEILTRDTIAKFLSIIHGEITDFRLLNVVLTNQIKELLNRDVFKECLTNASVFKSIKLGIQELILFPFNRLSKKYLEIMEGHAFILDQILMEFQKLGSDLIYDIYVKNIMKDYIDFNIRLYTFIASKKSGFINLYADFNNRNAENWMSLALEYHKYFFPCFFDLIRTQNVLIRR